jgi:hypothetical protein
VPTPGPGLIGLEIVGPDAVQPGSSTQLRAIASVSDGSSRDVTRAATWSVTPATHSGCSGSTPLTVSISDDGVLAAARSGDAIATARLSGGLEDRKEILSLPQGTFRLIGVVTIGDIPGAPLPFVQIEVVQGTGAGLQTATTGDGCYALFGLSGSVTIRLTRDGYETREEAVELLSHTVHDMAMSSSSGVGYWDYSRSTPVK